MVQLEVPGAIVGSDAAFAYTPEAALEDVFDGATPQPPPAAEELGSEGQSESAGISLAVDDKSVPQPEGSQLGNVEPGPRHVVAVELVETLHGPNGPPDGRNTPPSLPGLTLDQAFALPTGGQIFYLDYDGAIEVDYNGPMAFHGLHIPAFTLPSYCDTYLSAFQDAVEQRLNAIFCDSGASFTRQQPGRGIPYSTLYIGGDGAAFSDHGSFLGLAEQVDTGNLDPCDIGLIFSDKLARGVDTLEAFAERLVWTIAEEAAHLLGYRHSGARDLPGRHGPLDAVANPEETVVASETLPWKGGGTYDWELNDVDAPSGEGNNPGWDLIRTGGTPGTLEITATPSNPFTLKVTSQTLSNTPGPVHDFDASVADGYAWRIVVTENGVKGFDPEAIRIDTTAFANSPGSGSFVVTLENDDHDLVLRFLPSTPFAYFEPFTWTPQGPFTLTVNNPIVDQAIGAVQVLAFHPANANVAFLGAVNGGVWFTENLGDADPAWNSRSDGLTSFSIGALAVSPFDGLGNRITSSDFDPDELVVYAGIGRFSSAGGFAGGAKSGLFKSTDGGLTWEAWGMTPSAKQSFFKNHSISSITVSAEDPNLIYVATDLGLFRTTDSGATSAGWKPVNPLSGNVSGLPQAGALDVVEDPTTPNRFFASLLPSGANGPRIFWTDKGNDQLAHMAWTECSSSITVDLDRDGTYDDPLTSATRIHLSFDSLGMLFAGILGSETEGKESLAGVFQCDSPAKSAATWTPLGSVPETNPGGQGDIHFALAVDTGHVYVAGDSHPTTRKGNVWRWTRTAGSPEWEPIVDTGAPFDGYDTAPHADTRNLYLVGADVISVDDGGIYRLSDADDTWNFIGDGLAISEVRNLAYDHVTHSLIAGTQDNGVIMQSAALSSSWSNLTGGDGNHVDVVYLSDTESLRYYMSNGLAFFYKKLGSSAEAESIVFDTEWDVDDFDRLDDKLHVPGHVTDYELAKGPGFYPLPIAANRVNPSKVLVGLNALYGSDNQGKSWTPLDDGSHGYDVLTNLIYGGWDSDGNPIEGLIYGSRGYYRGGNNTLYVSIDGGQSFDAKVLPARGFHGSVSGLAADSGDWHNLFISTLNRIYLLQVAEKNGKPDLSGSVPIDITGDLIRQTAEFHSIEVITLAGRRTVLVGAQDGIYRLDLPSMTGVTGAAAAWTRFGEGLPYVPVSEIVYDEIDNVIAAGTLGRGAYLLSDARNAVLKAATLVIAGSNANEAITLELQENNPFNLEIRNGPAVLDVVDLNLVREVSIYTFGGDDSITISYRFGEIPIPITIDAGQESESSGDNAIFTGELLNPIEPVGEDYYVDGTDVTLRHLEKVSDDSGLYAFLEGVGLGLQECDPSFSSESSGESYGILFYGSDLLDAAGGAEYFGEFPVSDPEDAEESPASSGSNGFGLSFAGLLDRLLSTEDGSFRLADLGSTISDPDELESLLDGLDDISGNVTVDSTTQTITLGDLSDSSRAFTRVFELELPLELALLGGAFNIRGALEASVTMKLMLKLGVDERGFYISTDASSLPEITFANLTVNGNLNVSAELGFLELSLLTATIASDPDLRLELDLTETEDRFGHDSDGKLRPYDFAASADALLNASIKGNDSVSDLRFSASFEVAPTRSDGEPLFDLGGASLDIIWDNLTDPTSIRLEASTSSGSQLLLSFLSIDATDMLGNWQSLVDVLSALKDTDSLNQLIPFGNGASTGQVFDVGDGFLHEIFLSLVDVCLTGNLGTDPFASTLSGQLEDNAYFTLQIGDADPVVVTVLAANTSTNTSLPDLVSDINDALDTAGLASNARAELEDGNVVLCVSGEISVTLANLDATDPFHTQLGFTQGQVGQIKPRFSSFQQLFRLLNDALFPDESDELGLLYDETHQQLSWEITLNLASLHEEASFAADPNLGLGDLASLEASGDIALDASLTLTLGLALDFSAYKTPELASLSSIPAPSSGRLSAPSSFDIVIDDGALVVDLPTLVTAGSSIDELVEELNGLLDAATTNGVVWKSTPINQVLEFIKTGSGVVLRAINEDLNANGVLDEGEDTALNPGVLDSQLGKVHSLSIVAEDDDPIITEVGFVLDTTARSVLKGLAITQASIVGVLAPSADNVTASATFGVFGISTSGGGFADALLESDATTSQITLNVGLENPDDPDAPIDLDTLVGDLENLPDYFSTATPLAGSLDFRLRSLELLPEDLPGLTVPDGSQIRIFIPDIHYLDYNPNPYDATNNKQGLFVTYPALGGLSNFSCTTFLDVVQLLAFLADTLGDLRGFGFLDAPLPLVNASISDLLDYASNVASAVEKLLEGDDQTVDALETWIEDELGLPADGFTISLDGTSTLKFAFDYTLGYGNTLPLQFDLETLAELAGVSLGSVASLVEVSGSAHLNISATAHLQIAVGLDVSNPCPPRPFLYDSSSLTFSASVTGTDLDFEASLGAVGLFIRNGQVTLDADGLASTDGDASVSVTLTDDDRDGRHYFDSFDLGAGTGGSFINVGFGAKASAVLPIYFPSEDIAFPRTSDGNGDSYPDNQLVITIGDLTQLFNNTVGSVTLITPDLDSLFGAFDPCDVLTNSSLFLDGLDYLLGLLQDGLDSEVFSERLPLIGTGFGKAADVIGSFREGLLSDLRTSLTQAGDPIALLQQALYNSLGPGGLDILYQTDGSAIADPSEISVVCDNEELLVDVLLQQSLALIDTTGNGLSLDLGIDGFGLELEGDIQISAGWSWNLSIGLSAADGFFLNHTDTADELNVGFDVTVPGLAATGTFFFLEAKASDESDGEDADGAARHSTTFSGSFDIDLLDPNDNDDRVTFAEMTRSGLDLGDLIHFSLGAMADIHLDLEMGFGDNGKFPRFYVEFDYCQVWGSVAPPHDDCGVPQFNHIRLDLGSFFSKFLRPIFEQIQTLTAPLQPVLDILTYPLPVLSDLSGGDVTLLDLAEAFGYIKSGTREFIEAVAAITELVNNTPLTSDTILIDFGGFSLNRDSRGDLSQIQEGVAQSYEQLSDIDLSDNPTFESDTSDFVSGVDTMQRSGLSLPFLKASEIFKLLMGQTVTLVEWELPLLDFSFTYTQKIPIFPPLYAFFSGTIGARIDLTVGYDTTGLQAYSSSRDLADLLDGFFVKDVDDYGQEITELTLYGSLVAGASIDLVAAEVGVQGGLFVDVGFDLHDNDQDGKVRVSEIVQNAKEDLRCIFDIHGTMTAALEAFLEVNLAILKIDKQWTFAEITLLEFDLVCPEPILANFTDDSTGEVRNGADLLDGASHELRLNMGPYAEDRLVGDTTDGDERFVVEQIGYDSATGQSDLRVHFNGIEQDFSGVGSLLVYGGSGDDSLDLRGLSIPATVYGGDGDDTIYGGDGAGTTLNGDAGNDRLYGSELIDDAIEGGDGNDILYGYAGADSLQGNAGTDILYGDSGTDTVEGGDGDDQLYGDVDVDYLYGQAGNDWIEGDDGADVIEAGGGNDTVYGGAGDDWIQGQEGDDLLYGQSGDDLLVGDRATITSRLVVHVEGSGNDILSGGGGSDVLFGCGGNDALYGGAYLINGIAAVIEADTFDFLDGGNGDDILVADDGHSSASVAVPGSSVTGTVWLDEDPAGADGPDGLRADAEAGIAGVSVDLYRVDKDETGADVVTLAGSTLTDNTGDYVFTGLSAGTYFVTFHTQGSLVFTSPSVSGDNNDSDAADGSASVPAGQTDRVELDVGEAAELDAGQRLPEGSIPALSIDDVVVTEADAESGVVTFTVSLSNPSSEIVTVCWETAEYYASDVSTKAVVEVDFEYADYTLVFQPGETTQTVEVRIWGDTIHELNETFAVRLSDPYRATLADDVGLVTIVNDDAAPAITIDDGVVPSVDDGTLTDAEIFAEQDRTYFPGDGDGTLLFTVRLSNPSYQAIRVDLRTAMIYDSNWYLLVDSAVEGVSFDYGDLFDPANPTITISSLTFDPGVVERTVGVRIYDDKLNETDERFQVLVGLSADLPSNAASIEDGVATGVILGSYVVTDATGFSRVTHYDDPQPVVVFDATAVSVTENHVGQQYVTFTLYLVDDATLRNRYESGQTVEVLHATNRGTATDVGTDTELADFVFASGTVTFAPGETMKEFTAAVLGDIRQEGSEVFFVNLLSAQSATLGENHAVVTILNDDLVDGVDHGPWSIQFSQATYTVDENAGEATLTILRTEASSNAVGYFWTAAGTATEGTDPTAADYTGVWENGAKPWRTKFRFAEGQTELTLTIPILNDNKIEKDETVTLYLGNPTGGPVLGNIRTAQLTIVDDEPRPEVSVDDAEANEGDGTLTFTVRLRFDADLELTYLPTLQYSTLEDSAIAPDDYTSVSLQSVDFTGAAETEDVTLFTFALGLFRRPYTIYEKTFTISLVNDDVNEPDETFHILLDNPTPECATITDREGLMTVHDNDTLAVSGLVFLDLNGNGLFDPTTEQPWAGIPVELHTVVFDETLQTYIDTITSGTTDADGFYTFTNLVLGDYRITVAEADANFPAGYTNTTANNSQTLTVTISVTRFADIGYQPAPATTANTAATAASTIYYQNTVYGGFGNDLLVGGAGKDFMIGGHWLGPAKIDDETGYDVHLETDNETNPTRLAVDPEWIPAPASISGLVWLDNITVPLLLGPEGVRWLPSEIGWAGITVHLYDAYYNRIATAITDASGAFAFSNLILAGDTEFHVQVLLPKGYRFTRQDRGGDENRDSDVDQLTGLTSSILVSPGSSVPNLSDAGLVSLSAVDTSLPWVVQFTQGTYSVDEPDQVAVISVESPTDSPQRIGYFYTVSVENGSGGIDWPLLERYLGIDLDALTALPTSATHGADYVGVYERGNGTQRLPIRFSGATSLLQFAIPIVEDSDTTESVEAFWVVLRNPTGGPVNGIVGAALVLIFDSPDPDNDTLYAGSGDDVLLGDFGNVSVDGTVSLAGGLGEDTLFGEDGTDILYGEGGDDELNGGSDGDTMTGGDGNDLYPIDGDLLQPLESIVETSDPLGGNDTIDLSTTTTDIVFDFSDLALYGVSGAAITSRLTLTLPKGVIENVLAGNGNDVLRGNELDNILDGGPGDDEFEGGAGNDSLLGGLGDDRYLFAADADLGADTLVEAVGAGQDTLDFSGTVSTGITLSLESDDPQDVNVYLTLTLATAEPSLTLAVGARTVTSIVRLFDGRMVEVTSAFAWENLIGGGGVDRLLGNSLDNQLQGGAGNDHLEGGEGDDTLVEDRAGNFSVLSGSPYSQIIYDDGTTLETDEFTPDFENVSLKGGSSADRLDASLFSGTVILDGGEGADTLIGGSGTNIITGGPGIDTLDLSRGTLNRLVEDRDAQFVLTNISLTIEGESDVITGTIHEAILRGGDGANSFDARLFTGVLTLEGRGGNDLLRGGSGQNTYLFDADESLGTDRIDSGAGGHDVLDFAATTSLGVVVDLSLPVSQQVNANLILILNPDAGIEDIVGGAMSDTLVGNQLNNILDGGEGSDTLSGGPGNDTLIGGPTGALETDRLEETRDADMTLADSTLNVGASEQDILTDIEEATLRGGSSENRLDANAFTRGPVTLDGGGGNDHLFGGGDNDTLIGGGGDDDLDGGNGDDVYVFDADDGPLGSDRILESGSGIDTIDYSSTEGFRVSINLSLTTTQLVNVRHQLTLWSGSVIENVIGTLQDDDLTGNNLDNTLLGLGGDDRLTGLAGDDYLEGGSGDDVYLFDADIDLGTDRIFELPDAAMGTDLLDFSATSDPIQIELHEGDYQDVNLDHPGYLLLALTTCHGIELVHRGGPHHRIDVAASPEIARLADRKRDSAGVPNLDADGLPAMQTSSAISTIDLHSGFQPVNVLTAAPASRLVAILDMGVSASTMPSEAGYTSIDSAKLALSPGIAENLELSARDAPNPASGHSQSAEALATSVATASQAVRHNSSPAWRSSWPNRSDAEIHFTNAPSLNRACWALDSWTQSITHPILVLSDFILSLNSGDNEENPRVLHTWRTRRLVDSSMGKLRL